MESSLKLYEQWLTDNGLIHNIDEDGDLHFKYQMCNFFILNPQEDDQFLHIILPNIWSIESEEERMNALKVANELNMGRKVLKVVVGESNTTLTVEMFIDQTPDVEDFMERLLDILIEGRQLFAKRMHDLMKE